MPTDDVVLLTMCGVFFGLLCFWLGYLRGRHDVEKQIARWRAASMGQGVAQKER